MELCSVAASLLLTILLDEPLVPQAGLLSRTSDAELRSCQPLITCLGVDVQIEMIFIGAALLWDSIRFV